MENWEGADITIQNKAEDFPESLQCIPDAPPRLYIKGTNSDILKQPAVAIVGSRKVTPYGRDVTTQLAAGLAKAGVVIVSGLALGVDAIAHQAALDVGGRTIAVLPGGMSRVYPASHTRLARQIIEQGGLLVSEYAAATPARKYHFIARNRLVSGLSAAVLITEATEKSGTLHTARFALEQGREVLAVPGNITSLQSRGTNRLIQTGASPILSLEDIFYAINLKAPEAPAKPRSNAPNEQRIIDLIASGVHETPMLLQQSKLTISPFNQALTMLEITGKIRSLGGNAWGLGE